MGATLAGCCPESPEDHHTSELVTLEKGLHSQVQSMISAHGTSFENPQDMESQHHHQVRDQICALQQPKEQNKMCLLCPEPEQHHCMVEV